MQSFLKVAVNPLDIIFLKFSESFIVAFQSLFSNKKGGGGGHRVSF